MASSKYGRSGDNRRVLRDTDGPYSWLVTMASFLAHVLIYGVIWSSGVFYDIFRDLFDSSSGAVALLATLSTACTFGLSPLTGVLINKYGHRVVTMVGGLIAGTGLCLSAYATNIYFLTATFGVITGLGFGFSYLGAISIVPLYVSKWRTVALGVAVSGVGFGTFVYPPMVRYMVHNFGVRGTLLVIGGLSYNVCVCGAIMRAPREAITHSGKAISSQQEEEKQRKYSTCKEYSTISLNDTGKTSRWKQFIRLFNFHIFTNKSYVALCINNFFALFGLAIFYVHIAAYSETKNISKDMAAMLVSTLGISNLIGRPLFGILAKLPCLSALFLYITSFILCGVTVLCLPLVDSFITLAVMTSLFGLFSASIGPLLPQLVYEFLSLSLIPSGYGYLLLFEALGSLLGPPAAGYLYDKVRMYRMSFFLSGGAVVISGVVMVIPYIIRKVMVRNFNAAAGDIVVSEDTRSSPDTEEVNNV